MQMTQFGLLPKLPFMLLLLAACQSDVRLMAFASDGCANHAAISKAGDNSMNNWCECCVGHDIAYWRGGTVEQRDQADARLRDCVARQTGNRELANTLYHDLRSGGSAYFVDGYRWAYGWSNQRQYQALNERELAMANNLLLDYFKAGKQICL